MIEKVEYPGAEKTNIAKTFGRLLSERLKKDKSFYFFSPDETTSNRLSAVYDEEKRAWSLPVKDFDLPSDPDGRIIELLSENALFAALIGHLSNGEQGMMASYEAFFSIITSQILQQIKFFNQMSNISWRKPWPAVNLLSTSMCWRQDHNGYSHQSPALISSLLSVPGNRVNCLFPIDDVSAEETFSRMLSSENVINLTTFDKNDNPRWIDSYHSKFQFDNGGASFFQFASDENPELVLTAVGDIPTREMLRARDLVKEKLPEKRLRFVGINALTFGKIGTTERSLSRDQFSDLFTFERPLIASFHGYPETLKSIFRNYTSRDVLSVHGFEEQGTTTTPLEMLSLNHASRFDLAADIFRTLGRPDLAEDELKKLSENREYAVMFGVDKFPLE